MKSVRLGMERVRIAETTGRTVIWERVMNMWQQWISHIREHPLSWVLVACVILAVIYVALNYENLFYRE